MTTKTKTKATKTKGTTLEARAARLLVGMLAEGLEAIRQHVQAKLGDSPFTPEQALSLADLCVDLARLRTALLPGERA